MRMVLIGQVDTMNEIQIQGSGISKSSNRSEWSDATADAAKAIAEDLAPIIQMLRKQYKKRLLVRQLEFKG